MLQGKKIIVILPAYNAERTLRKTYEDLPLEYIDDVVLVDDASRDGTVALARQLGISTIIHQNNKGYGANQKTCYREALKRGADIIVMVHPDYQYSPRLVTAMASMIASGHYDIVLGSRILGGGTVKSGMPVYKYLANRMLTFIENIMLGVKLSEFHTGFRAYSRIVLETLPLEENSDGFVFDNELIAQAIYFGFRTGEISCPTRYFAEASSIPFIKSMWYGLGVLSTIARFSLSRTGIKRYRLFDARARRIV